MKTLHAQPGDEITITAPSGGFTSGALTIVASGVSGICGLPMNTVAEGSQSSVAIKNRQAKLPAVTGVSWSAGAVLYRKASDGKLTSSSTGNTRAGRAGADKATNDTEAILVLNMP